MLCTLCADTHDIYLKSHYWKQILLVTLSEVKKNVRKVIEISRQRTSSTLVPMTFGKKWVFLDVLVLNYGSQHTHSLFIETKTKQSHMLKPFYNKTILHCWWILAWWMMTQSTILKKLAYDQFRHFQVHWYSILCYSYNFQISIFWKIL